MPAPLLRPSEVVFVDLDPEPEPAPSPDATVALPVLLALDSRIVNISAEPVTASAAAHMADVNVRETGYSIWCNRRGALVCFSCLTSKTPYWRPGWTVPAIGTVNLCNACGMRFSKYRAHCPDFSCRKVPCRAEGTAMCPRPGCCKRMVRC